MQDTNARSATASLPIGVFDSGVGGLTVLRALTRRLPCEDFLYLGDTARLPYGTKSPASISRYALQAAQVLVDRGVKLLVVACNTASAVALPGLRKAFPKLPVLGVVGPGARAACAGSKQGRIAIIATESTIHGGAYQKAIRKLRPDAVIHAKACPLFVTLAEEAWTSGKLVEDIARAYLDPLFAAFTDESGTGPDSLVLGCTHFPALAEPIGNVVGDKVRVIDSAATTAAEVEEFLARYDLTRENCVSRMRFLATDGADRFARVGGVFLGRELRESDVEVVDL
ncbi:MAG: glutamate racemase [Desulfovibrionaceae bacterium]